MVKNEITLKQTNSIIEELDRNGLKICDGELEIGQTYFNEVVNNNIKEEEKVYIDRIDFMELWGDDDKFCFYWCGEDKDKNYITSPSYEDVDTAKEDFQDMMKQRGYIVKLRRVDGKN